MRRRQPHGYRQAASPDDDIAGVGTGCSNQVDDEPNDRADQYEPEPTERQLRAVAEKHPVEQRVAG